MKVIFLIAVIYTLNFLLFPNLALAQSCEDSTKCDNFSPEQIDQKKTCIDDLISQCETLLSEGQQKENTLRSRLNVIDGQTRVTTLKIEETNLQEEKLQKQIVDLSTNLDKIGQALNLLSDTLLEKIIKTYEYSNTVSTISLLFSSNGLSELLERLKYIQVAEVYDKKKLYELQATKLKFNNQKQDKQSKQIEADNLKKKLEIYKRQLDDQRKTKDDLLRVTKNDEARYQGLIAELKADADSIARAISNIRIAVGPVKKGQVVGYEGLTGCTSGPHLHFEIYNNSKVENSSIIDKNTNQPVNSLSDAARIWSYLMNPHIYLDSSQIGPPMQGYPISTHISTEFGQIYALGKHTGLDIYDDAYVGTPLLATFDGTAYALADRGCPGENIGGINFDHGPAKGLVIDSGSGLVTLYWHLL